jgi:hypothetical protein
MKKILGGMVVSALAVASGLALRPGTGAGTAGGPSTTVNAPAERPWK